MLSRHPYRFQSNRWSLAACLCLVMASPGLAADPQTNDADQNQTVEEIVVTAAFARGAAVATKLPMPLSETPQTISIIDRDRLDQQALVNLDEVMANVPGITVQPGTRLRTAYYSRGFVIDTLNFDGIPTSGWNEAVNTEDMAIYDSVEVLRGAAGLMQGSGNPSGTINLVRKRPGREMAATAGLMLGSWDNRRIDADVSLPITTDGSLRGRLVGVAEERDFYYGTHRRKYLGYGTLEWNLSPDTVLAATIKKQDVEDDGAFMGTPLYSDGSPLDIPISRRLYADWSRREWNNTQAFVELKHRFWDDWEAKVAFSHITGDSLLDYASAYGAVNKATGTGPILYGGAYDFDNKETDLDGYVSGGFNLAGRRHQLVLGANYWDGDTSQISYSLPGLMQPLNLFAENPVTTPAPANRTFAGRQDTGTRQYGGYGVLRFSLADPLNLILGGRLSSWRTKTDRQASVGGPLVPTGEYKIDNEFTPYGGLVWKVGGPFSLYGSYAAIFTPQNYLTADGRVIDPMTGSNYEAGVKAEWFQGRLNASAALFRVIQNNRAQLDPRYPCVTGATCYYVAEGKVRSQGFDTGIEGKLTPDWSLQAGYTFTETEYLRDQTATGAASSNEGQAFSSFTPKHMLRLWSHYHLPVLERRLGVGAGVNWQSRFYAKSSTLVLNQGAYATVNLRADYAVSDNVSLGLNVNNLFDKRYFATLSNTAWNNWYGDPRNVMLSLRVGL